MQILEHELEAPTYDLCIYPNECCMPGPHFAFECHTSEMAEELARDAEESFN